MNYCHILFLFKILDTGVLDHILQDQYFGVVLSLSEHLCLALNDFLLSGSSLFFPYLGHKINLYNITLTIFNVNFKLLTSPCVGLPNSTVLPYIQLRLNLYFQRYHTHLHNHLHFHHLNFHHLHFHHLQYLPQSDILLRYHQMMLQCGQQPACISHHIINFRFIHNNSPQAWWIVLRFCQNI
jgi:hypothetical protein